ncbi:MAG: PEP-CTERM sorting domain-containing protein [Isosphaeraceae bacterium]
MVAQRSENPARFDRLHLVLGDMLSNRSSFEYWYNRWQADPARFEHWHPLFWRIIDGESIAGGSPINPSPISPSIPPLIPPAGQGDISPVTPSTPSGPPPPPPSPLATVPEPGTVLLVLEGLGLILLARRGCACLRSK